MSTNVRDLYLKNEGGYTCKMYVRWKNPGSSHWNDAHTATLMLGQSHTSNPGIHGAVDGAQLGIGIDIEAGSDTDNDSADLIYESGSNATGNFTCSGTTLDPSLGFTGVSK